MKAAPISFETISLHTATKAISSLNLVKAILLEAED
jgi:hypothetical protein